MNPYSQLDQDTLGQMASANVDPAGGTLYPTYPNAAGVGSQTAGAVPQAQPQTPQAPGQPQLPAPLQPKVEVPDTSSRGMSPYSLIGEANYR